MSSIRPLKIGPFLEDRYGLDKDHASLEEAMEIVRAKTNKPNAGPNHQITTSDQLAAVQEGLREADFTEKGVRAEPVASAAVPTRQNPRSVRGPRLASDEQVLAEIDRLVSTIQSLPEPFIPADLDEFQGRLGDAMVGFKHPATGVAEVMTKEDYERRVASNGVVMTRKFLDRFTELCQLLWIHPESNLCELSALPLEHRYNAPLEKLISGELKLPAGEVPGPGELSFRFVRLDARKIHGRLASYSADVRRISESSLSAETLASKRRIPLWDLINAVYAEVSTVLRRTSKEDVRMTFVAMIANGIADDFPLLDPDQVMEDLEEIGPISGPGEESPDPIVERPERSIVAPRVTRHVPANSGHNPEEGGGMSATDAPAPEAGTPNPAPQSASAGVTTDQLARLVVSLGESVEKLESSVGHLVANQSDLKDELKREIAQSSQSPALLPLADRIEQGVKQAEDHRKRRESLARTEAEDAFDLAEDRRKLAWVESYLETGEAPTTAISADPMELVLKTIDDPKAKKAIYEIIKPDLDETQDRLVELEDHVAKLPRPSSLMGRSKVAPFEPRRERTIGQRVPLVSEHPDIEAEAIKDDDSEEKTKQLKPVPPAPTPDPPKEPEAPRKRSPWSRLTGN